MLYPSIYIIFCIIHLVFTVLVNVRLILTSRYHLGHFLIVIITKWPHHLKAKGQVNKTRYYPAEVAFTSYTFNNFILYKRTFRN